MCIALVLAGVTCIFVRPDSEYAGYFDLKTLVCLFVTLAVVCALKNIRFFYILARKMVRLTGDLRSLTIVLIIITFAGSMLIANDMALITFLPIGYFALSSTGKEKYSAYIFILQNISANLGGMLTPFGNPQNLYLYSFFNIPTGEFVRIMLPLFVLAVALLMLCTLPLKREKLQITEEYEGTLPPTKTFLYLILFALTILTVFRIIPFYVALVIVTAVLFAVDREALKAVDYPLLFTFAFFFVFSGNLSRVEPVKDFFSALLEKNTLIPSVLSCQVISNVPTAILLSRFTEDYRSLLMGVNIGGTGTLIASLASLITFSEFRILYPDRTKQYLGYFVILNVFFLAALTAFAYFVL